MGFGSDKSQPNTWSCGSDEAYLRSRGKGCRNEEWPLGRWWTETNSLTLGLEFLCGWTSKLPVCVCVCGVGTRGTITHMIKWPYGNNFVNQLWAAVVSCWAFPNVKRRHLINPSPQSILQNTTVSVGEKKRLLETLISFEVRPRSWLSAAKGEKKIH